MKTTCGVFLVCNNKLLIGHVTNSQDWSIPKGLIDPNETELEAALRELKEETNIDSECLKFHNGTQLYVPYEHKKKTLCAFLAFTDIEHDAICYSIVTSHGGEPFPEIDYFKWVNFDEAFEKIHPTQKSCLRHYIDHKFI